MSLRPAFAVLVAGVAVLCGCRDNTVTLGFRPAVDAVYRYDVTSESTSTTELSGEAPAEDRDRVVVHAAQRVLETSQDGSRVSVTLTVGGVGSQDVVVQLDRAAQLTAIETVEGIPAETFSGLGLSEIFPAAAGAPPDRELRPGESWKINDRVQLAGMAEPAGLSATGRLVKLSIENGRHTATVTSHYSLPVTSTVTSAAGARTLRGTQEIDVTVVYDLADGSVLRLTAATKGTYELELAPPPGSPARPVSGTLTVTTKSETVRAG